ncbi:MAG: malto-oligosyltrehalose synthase [Pirellulales bacterium]
MLEASPEMRTAIDETLTDFNGQGGVKSFDRLEAFLNAQAYRLCYWRVATDEINYRRFFDVDSLAAIRMEDPDVFDAVHATVLKYMQQGLVTALRIDHADGLFDPRQYLSLLAKRADAAARIANPEMTDDRTYIVAEKIVAYDETIPDDWPIAGTTGYDFLNLLNGLFVDRDGSTALRDGYFRCIEDRIRFEDVVYEGKRTILATSLASELNVLAQRLSEIAEQDRRSRDFTASALHRALGEVFACFPVYRTYNRPESTEPRPEDRRRIEFAVRTAKRRNPAISGAFFDFIGSVLLLEQPANADERVRAARRLFALRFQQISGPVTAKGFEDTALYRYYPLASLNEVGGHPSHPPLGPQAFHAEMIRRATDRPRDMNTTSTHDTKRGEGVRARLNVLSEMPERWESSVRHWHELNASARSEYDGAQVPSLNEEYLIYQTIVGTYVTGPRTAEQQLSYADRIVRYCEKAFREAKVNTSWLNPHGEYEKAIADFVKAILSDDRSEFRREVAELVESIHSCGCLNELSQTLLKIRLPGIPDFYQGSEEWDFRLVDPDNRNPVDFAARRNTIEASIAAERHGEADKSMRELVCAWPDARLKIAIIRKALEFRRALPGPFFADYVPLIVRGEFAKSVFAFLRRDETDWILCVTPRLTYGAFGDLRASASPWPTKNVWKDTRIVLPAHCAACLAERISCKDVSHRSDRNPGIRLRRRKVIGRISGRATRLRSFLLRQDS